MFSTLVQCNLKFFVYTGKLTLEKAISLARASKLLKEQNDENPSVNEIQVGSTTGCDKQKQNPLR